VRIHTFRRLDDSSARRGGMSPGASPFAIPPP